MSGFRKVGPAWIFNVDEADKNEDLDSCHDWVSGNAFKLACHVEDCSLKFHSLYGPKISVQGRKRKRYTSNHDVKAYLFRYDITDVTKLDLQGFEKCKFDQSFSDEDRIVVPVLTRKSDLKNVTTQEPGVYMLEIACGENTERIHVRIKEDSFDKSPAFLVKKID